MSDQSVAESGLTLCKTFFHNSCSSSRHVDFAPSLRTAVASHCVFSVCARSADEDECQISRERNRCASSIATCSRHHFCQNETKHTSTMAWCSLDCLDESAHYGGAVSCRDCKRMAGTTACTLRQKKELMILESQGSQDSLDDEYGCDKSEQNRHKAAKSTSKSVCM